MSESAKEQLTRIISAQGLSQTLVLISEICFENTLLNPKLKEDWEHASGAIDLVAQCNESVRAVSSELNYVR